MKNLNKAQIAELANTKLVTTWINIGTKQTDFNGSLLEYCNDNNYKFTAQKKEDREYIKISYTYGTNDNIIICPAHKLTLTLLETVCNNKIYIGGKVTIKANGTNNGLFGEFFRRINK